MGWKFNPFTGALDQTGSGGGASYIDGEVATYNDLPLDGTAALNSAWLVRTASGVWPVTRRQAGIYIRTATAGSSRDADFTYAGTMPDVFSDAVFTLYDDASTTRTGQFNLGSITAGQNRVLTWPDGNGTIARTSDIPSTFAASAVTSGVFDNARINFAAPDSIGSTTANAGSFTTLNATGTTELVNGGTTAGPFRLYNTSSSGNANFERLRIAWASNVAIIGTEKAGTGSARNLEFHYDGTVALRLYSQGVNIRQSALFGFSSNGITGVDVALERPSAGVIRIVDNNTNNPPALRIHNASGSTEYAALRWASNEFILDANAGTGTLRGIKLGSTTSSLLGFYGVTPVDQPATVADPAGGGTVDAEARTAINAVIDRLQELGLIA